MSRVVSVQLLTIFIFVRFYNAEIFLYEPKVFFQFEIFINVLALCASFAYLCYVSTAIASDVYLRQILTSTVRAGAERLK